MATVSPGFTFSVQHPALKASRRNLALASPGFFRRRPRGKRRGFHRPGECAHTPPESVQGMAQNPAAVTAMGVHTSFAEVALQTRSDARNDDLVSNMKLRDRGPYLLDHANALVAENSSIGHGRGRSPLRMWRSVPQIVVVVIRAIASPGSWMAGRGLSSTLLAGPVVNQGFHPCTGAGSRLRGRKFKFSSSHWYFLQRGLLFSA